MKFILFCLDTNCKPVCLFCLDLGLRTDLVAVAEGLRATVASKAWSPFEKAERFQEKTKRLLKTSFLKAIF